ncbi:MULTISPECIES: hypothetical protein [unclassified Ruegeria]|uniref:hypothetical protein n=1 Tax=unclassified Ruegeria TaxID=2625375 RepID=UPI001488BD1B|nr:MULTISPECIES: hypothetical protein [unclassified Ruegeria]
MPKITTRPGTGRVKRDTLRVLSITWSGETYVFADSGRSYASNESRYDAVDLLDVDFSLTLDRRNMKAIAKSKTSVAYASRDGFADGSCTKITNPNS